MHRIEAYIRLAVIFIAAIGILYLPVLLWLKRRGKSVFRQLGCVGFGCSVFLIIFATILFVPITFHPETHSLNLIPFHWVGKAERAEQLIVEKIPNVMLFIPLGFFLPVVFRSKRKLWKTVSISFAVTFSVEFVQYFIGRSSDIDDILTNLLGAILGYMVFVIFGKILRKRAWWQRLLGNLP